MPENPYDVQVFPRYILTEGNGFSDKGQKTEWATMKDGVLYVGSFGKEYTTPDGKMVTSRNNLWIKTIDGQGTIRSIDWTENYVALRRATNTLFPGYLIIEALEFDAVHRQWVCLPRRVSEEPYDEDLDESRGSNLMLRASEDFSTVEVIPTGLLTPRRGFSSFKFLPGSRNKVIVALKSEEDAHAETQTTYITVNSVATARMATLWRRLQLLD